MYAGMITEGVISRPCSHVHASIAEALDCAAATVTQPGSTTTVVGAEPHPDGLTRHRDLNPAEQAELQRLIDAGRGRG